MADNTQLPNGFTGFAFRKPAGGTSAADAIREREASARLMPVSLRLRRRLAVAGLTAS